MTVALWVLIIGVLLIDMVLSGTLLKRLPLSTAMLCLAGGFALGPAGWAVLTPHPLNQTRFLAIRGVTCPIVSPAGCCHDRAGSYLSACRGGEGGFPLIPAA